MRLREYVCICGCRREDHAFVRKGNCNHCKTCDGFTGKKPYEYNPSFTIDQRKRFPQGIIRNSEGTIVSPPTPKWCPVQKQSTDQRAMHPTLLGKDEEEQWMTK